MRAIFDQNDMTFKLIYEKPIEEQQANISFNRKIKDWVFKTKGKGGWKGDVMFIHNFKIPAGLWGELKEMCGKYGYPLKVEGFNAFLRTNLDFADVKAFCDEMRNAYNATLPEEKRFKERPYQAKAVYMILKYRACMVDLATAAGKTWIMFLYVAYVSRYLPKGQILTIEPDPEYVIQTFSEINNFVNACRIPIKIGMVSGTSSLKDISDFDYVIGNFQTLGNREKDFYEKVRYILVDEGHRAKSKTIRDIMKHCNLAKDRVGLSGSVVADKTADHYTILAATGPVVIRVSKKDLMDAGFAPKIKIKIYVITYLTQEQKKEIAFLKESQAKIEIDLYNHELFVMRNNALRLDFLAKLIADLPLNSLTFFSDVQNEYGRKIYAAVRAKTNTKELYYIDGSIDVKMRDLYKAKMEEGTNKGLIATYPTYATGKSIKNLHYFVAGEPVKSEVVIGQAQGRGMREFLDKEEFHWIDVVDDFRWKGKFSPSDKDDITYTNILYKQMRERIRQYENDGFQYEIIKINLLDKASQPKLV